LIVSEKLEGRLLSANTTFMRMYALDIEYKAQRIVTRSSVLRGTSMAGSPSGELLRRHSAALLTRAVLHPNPFSEAELSSFRAVVRGA